MSDAAEQKPPTPAELMAMSAAQLDALFARSPVGPMPQGSGDGVALIAEGTPMTPILAEAIKHFVWQGKVFDPAAGRLINRVSPLGVEAVIGEVYEGPSWFDQQPCIIVDYSKTSLINYFVRDELRLIGPGLRLAKTYFDKVPVLHFTLQFA